MGFSPDSLGLNYQRLFYRRLHEVMMAKTGNLPDVDETSRFERAIELVCDDVRDNRPIDQIRELYDLSLKFSLETGVKRVEKIVSSIARTIISVELFDAREPQIELITPQGIVPAGVSSKRGQIRFRHQRVIDQSANNWRVAVLSEPKFKGQSFEVNWLPLSVIYSHIRLLDPRLPWRNTWLEKF